MSIDVEAYFGHVSDVARVNGSAIDNLQMAWVPQGVQRQVMVLCEVFVDEGKTGGSIIDQGVCV